MTKRFEPVKTYRRGTVTTPKPSPAAFGLVVAGELQGTEFVLFAPNTKSLKTIWSKLPGMAPLDLAGARPVAMLPVAAVQEDIEDIL